MTDKLTVDVAGDKDSVAGVLEALTRSANLILKSDDITTKDANALADLLYDLRKDLLDSFIAQRRAEQKQVMSSILDSFDSLIELSEGDTGIIDSRDLENMRFRLSAMEYLLVNARDR